MLYYVLLMFIILDQVSIVIGNQVFSVIKNMLVLKFEGKINRYSGSSVVDGIGFSRCNIGCIQQLICCDQLMVRLVMNLLLVFSSILSFSSFRECSRLLSRCGQLLCSILISVCGGVKNGIGNMVVLVVSFFQIVNSIGSSVSYLLVCSICVLCVCQQ